MTSTEIIHFWFEECSPKDWFFSKKMDPIIREKFEPTYWEVVAGEHENWRKTIEGRLAEILVLDQFSRNMFRKTAQSFTHDPLALALSQEAVRTGEDITLTTHKRQFLYMPFMHSESPKIQERSIELFTSLNNQDILKYAIDHQKIIQQFGRFPARNQALGRTSTPEEQTFLKTT